MSSTPLGNWCDVSVYPSSEGISIYWIDISERKSAEEKLHRAHDELENKVADGLPSLA